jgi:N-acyl homoserine lactone hydrolase
LTLRDAIDGIATDEAAARRTLERIRTYAGTTPTVYLPSHDPESARRLARQQIVPTAAEKSGL